ncbi:MAG: 30S ribosomal protein S2 [Candidatus Andersenbacteria bacterium]
MIKLPSLKELLASGAHFGQRTARWHPKMGQYLFGSSKGVHIINLEKTREKLAEAAEFALNLTRRGGVILFVGTKPQARKPVTDAALTAGMPYVTGRWLGGLFTNFTTVLDLLRKLERLENDRDKGKLELYTKREQLDVQRQIKKLHEAIGGIKSMRRLPEAIFVVDVTVDQIAIKEARRKKIPVIAIVDSNGDPSKVDYPIPANDDAIKTLELICNVMAQAILEGRKLTPTPAAPAPAAVPGAAASVGSAESKKITNK